MSCSPPVATSKHFPTAQLFGHLNSHLGVLALILCAIQIYLLTYLQVVVGIWLNKAQIPLRRLCGHKS